MSSIIILIIRYALDELYSFPAGRPDVVPAAAAAPLRSIGERHQLRVDVSEERGPALAHLKGRMSVQRQVLDSMVGLLCMRHG